MRILSILFILFCVSSCHDIVQLNIEEEPISGGDGLIYEVTELTLEEAEAMSDEFETITCPTDFRNCETSWKRAGTLTGYAQKRCINENGVCVYVDYHYNLLTLFRWTQFGNPVYC